MNGWGLACIVVCGLGCFQQLLGVALQLLISQLLTKFLPATLRLEQSPLKAKPDQSGRALLCEFR
jgi:hypothetical protein